MTELSTHCAAGTCSCCGNGLRSPVRLAEDIADARADIAAVYAAAIEQGFGGDAALALLEPLAASVVAETNAELHGEHLDCARPFQLAAFRSRAASLTHILPLIR